MTDDTAALARAITWRGSKQAYWTARLMVDRDLVDDCCRAYAYFRWADDVIDVEAGTDDERTGFIRRQRALIEGLYRGERPGGLSAEEEMIATLVRHDRWEDSGLRSFILNFLAVIEFDAYRKGRLVGREELARYSARLAKSVTDGILYFCGNGHPYPEGGTRTLAATGAHLTHMLRDMVEDLGEGFVNVPREDVEAYGIDLGEVGSPAFRAWVRDRVGEARRCFEQGKRYLDGLDVLRTKIVAYWYCVRFERVLDRIEGDGYVLRPLYDERRRLSTWLRIAQMATSITLRDGVFRRRGAGRAAAIKR